MKKRLALLAAATIGVGGLTYMGSNQLWAAQGRDNPTAVDALQPRADETGSGAVGGALKTPTTQPGVAGAQKAGGKMTLPEGITPKDLREENDIRNSIADTTEQWLDKDGFDDLISRFVDADRNRLKDFANQHAGDLNGAIDSFKGAWKEKYGKEFDFVKGSDLFNDARYVCLQGEISNPAMLSNWPVQASPGTDTPKTDPGQRTPGDRPNINAPGGNGAGGVGGNVGGNVGGVGGNVGGNVGGVGGNVGGNIGGGRSGDNPTAAGPDIARPGAVRDGNAPGDRNLEKGRNVAVFSFPAANNLPLVNVSLIHEAIDSWKYDVPDNLTGERLLENLKTHLFTLGQQKDQWPADANDGYRLLAHHLAMAVYDVPMPKANGMKKEGMQPGGGTR